MSKLRTVPINDKQFTIVCEFNALSERYDIILVSDNEQHIINVTDNSNIALIRNKAQVAVIREYALTLQNAGIIEPLVIDSTNGNVVSELLIDPRMYNRMDNAMYMNYILSKEEFKIPMSALSNEPPYQLQKLHEAQAQEKQKLNLPEIEKNAISYTELFKELEELQQEKRDFYHFINNLSIPENEVEPNNYPGPINL